MLLLLACAADLASALASFEAAALVCPDLDCAAVDFVEVDLVVFEVEVAFVVVVVGVVVAFGVIVVVVVDGEEDVAVNVEESDEFDKDEDKCFAECFTLGESGEIREDTMNDSEPVMLEEEEGDAI